MNLTNLDITVLIPATLTREIIITLQPVFRRAVKPESPIEQVIRALHNMRDGGYEVDIYLNGWWCKGRSNSYLLNSYRLENWRLTESGIVASGEPTQWSPMVSRRPRPEIILRGVK